MNCRREITRENKKASCQSDNCITMAFTAALTIMRSNTFLSGNVVLKRDHNREAVWCVGVVCAAFSHTISTTMEGGKSRKIRPFVLVLKFLEFLAFADVTISPRRRKRTSAENFVGAACAMGIGFSHFSRGVYDFSREDEPLFFS